MPSLLTFDLGPSTTLERLVAPESPQTATRPKTTAPGVLSRLIECGKRPWRRRSLRRAFAAAKLALGERMFAAGIDDGELGAQIAVADDAIRRAEVVKAPTRALRANRQELLVRLAEAALEQEAPLPGADDEYDQARRAEAALRDYDASLAEYDTL